MNIGGALSKVGILLVNLGTPNSPKPKDVKRYLKEFLTDKRVIDLPFIQRHLLVQGVIIPKRYKESAKLYESIWTKEGSPLLVYGKKVEILLQEKLGEGFDVKLAMRYQNPSIESGLAALRGCQKLIILPLFPQFASASTGSVYQKVFEILSKWEIIPELHMISNYANHPALIEAFATRGREKEIETFDHILFSYHGLPEHQVQKADRTGRCLKISDCCEKNPSCYSAQCFATTKGIVANLKIPEGKWSQCFQSRLGKDPWLKPYAATVLEKLATDGKKKVLVFCPAFVADCLETLEEIEGQYQKDFKASGGEILELVKGLNDHPKWIEALEILIHDNLSRTRF